MNLQTLLLLIAVILLTVSAFITPARVSLLSLGLAFFAASFLVPALT